MAASVTRANSIYNIIRKIINAYQSKEPNLVIVEENIRLRMLNCKIYTLKTNSREETKLVKNKSGQGLYTDSTRNRSKI